MGRRANGQERKAKTIKIVRDLSSRRCVLLDFLCCLSCLGNTRRSSGIVMASFVGDLWLWRYLELRQRMERSLGVCFDNYLPFLCVWKTETVPRICV